jgi:hypothetical protein
LDIHDQLDFSSFGAYFVSWAGSVQVL